MAVITQISTKVAEALAHQIVRKLVDGKTPEDILKISMDEAISDVVRFSDTLESETARTFLEATNKAISELGEGAPKMWEFPKDSLLS